MSELARRIEPPTAEPYPGDLSDLSPRLLAAYARQGITAEEIRAARARMTPEETAQARAYEASLARMGMTLEDVEDPAPLSDEERAALLEGLAEADVSPAFRASILRTVNELP